MIKVFRVPSGKREYRALYRRIQESRQWQILAVSRNLLTDEWQIRCCDKNYFLSQSIERQTQIARGERRAHY
jgi:hypothetical protein